MRVSGHLLDFMSRRDATRLSSFYQRTASQQSHSLKKGTSQLNSWKSLQTWTRRTRTHSKEYCKRRWAYLPTGQPRNLENQNLENQLSLLQHGRQNQNKKKKQTQQAGVSLRERLALKLEWHVYKQESFVVVIMWWVLISPCNIHIHIVFLSFSPSVQFIIFFPPKTMVGDLSKGYFIVVMRAIHSSSPHFLPLLPLSPLYMLFSKMPRMNSKMHWISRYPLTRRSFKANPSELQRVKLLLVLKKKPELKRRQWLSRLCFPVARLHLQSLCGFCAIPTHSGTSFDTQQVPLPKD